ncbi:MAG: TonB-dependent receptor [Acidobacteriota bacterium]
MWRSFLARVLIWFVALAGLGLYAAAQTNTGNVYGTVTDEQGSAIPGGSATLTGSLAPRTTSVDEAGHFRFLKVSPAKYSVVVTMPGFTTVTREDVIVVLGKDINVDIQLRISNVQEKVVVSGATPLIDTRKVSTGATFSRDELTDIPTSRDIYSLIQQVPGVQLDSVNVAGNASAVAGGPDFVNKGSNNVTYLIDGSTVTDNTYGNPDRGQNGGTNTFFDYDTFQNVEVTTGGSLLDLQNPGVQINVVTKRGTNELKGSARFLYASANWQSKNTPQEAVDLGLQTDSTRFIREYGAEFGGPLIKDKVWLWASGSRQDISLNLAGDEASAAGFVQTVKLSPWSAKLNWQISQPNAINLYFNRSNRFEDGRGAGADRAPETLLTLSIPTNFYKIEDNHVFSSSLFASIFLNYQKPVYTDIPRGGLDVQEDYFDFQYHGSYNYYFAKDPQRQANAQVSKFFNTGKLSHELKVTFNYRQQIADSATGFPGDQIYGLMYSYSSAYAAVTGGVRTTYRTEYWTGTIGDTVTVGNFTLNAGLRYDYQRGKNLPGYRLANDAFPDIIPFAHFKGNKGWPYSYNNLQPRASVSYALGEKKNTLLRASYAKYADQLGFTVYNLSGVPITGGIYYYWTDANGDHVVQPSEIDLDSFAGFYNVDPTVAPNPPNALQPDFKTPTTDEVTFGIDQQLSQDFAVSATYTYRNLKHIQYRVPIGTTADTWALAGVAEGTAVAENGFTLPFSEPYYGITLEDPPPGDLFLNRPGATQTFHGVEFSAIKRLSHNWMLRGSFGWQSNKNHVQPESILDPNNLWNLGGQNDDGGLATGYSSKAFVQIGANWQYSITGMYQMPWGINVSANFLGRQGYPNPYYVRASTFDAGAYRPRILIDQVDSFRYDNVYQLDLRLEKGFKIGPVVFTPTAEVFNLTNNNTVLQRFERAGTFNVDDGFTQDPKFNRIEQIQSPRILRLGARIAF